MAGDTGMAGKVALLLWAQTLGLAGAQTALILVEPPWTLPVLWDQVTLTCQGSGTTGATTWYKDGQRWGQEGCNHFPVTEKGTYTCDKRGTGRSPSVRVLDDMLVLQVPARALLEGDTVTLRCRGWQNNTVTSVSFYHEGKKLEVFPNGTELSLSPLQLNHSGHYTCKGWVGDWGWTESMPVTVTVHMPVANATITLSPPAHQVRAGDNVTLRCSVQVGSAPVTFTWLHNKQEVARGPLLELGDIDVGHSGTYQCMATNQLEQDGHRVFQALSPELALAVTLREHCNKGGITQSHQGSAGLLGLRVTLMCPPLFLAVAAGVSGALLFLLLLVGVIVAWHRWHRVAARKQQERAPPDPPAPPEEGEVLYTHVVVTKRAGASPRATTLQDPQVTYAELRGPQGPPREPGDIYGNVL
ncbi:Fc receptor-like protein 4 isoform X2 [Motacilla alba alba]|uniref:Fc receptor-like protein 4 isoform X2 n=1 Tax=Motacilla alba alba TaxID=1094192 RepID=UPI0018D5518B|nr:Fc receptor-like protein 4 isoform X2 [Motacilla alba alba]